MSDMQFNFLVMVFGFPVLVFLVAVLAGWLYRGSDADVIDWTPTRSPRREAELELSDIEQMLAAQNELRRLRGAPERTLEEATEHPWAGLETATLPGAWRGDN